MKYCVCSVWRLMSAGSIVFVMGCHLSSGQPYRRSLDKYLGGSMKPLARFDIGVDLKLMLMAPKVFRYYQQRVLNATERFVRRR